MKLREYVDASIFMNGGKGNKPRPGIVGTTRKEVLTAIAEQAKVSLSLLLAVDRGQLIGQYKVAKRISETTGGWVTIKELCE